MTEFLLEMHAHSAEVSPCATAPAHKAVEQYIREGYSGMVITDHYNARLFRHMTTASPEEKMRHFLRGFYTARDAATDNFVVLPGMEISFDTSPNDYLVYGIDEDFLTQHQDLYRLDLKAFRELATAHNLLVFQAHPFRVGMKIADYRLLDGIEVYNGNSSHNSNNDIAALWAKKYNLLPISGSDYHCWFGMKPGGLVFDTAVKSNAELLKALREKTYRLR